MRALAAWMACQHKFQPKLSLAAPGLAHARVGDCVLARNAFEFPMSVTRTLHPQATVPTVSCTHEPHEPI